MAKKLEDYVISIPDFPEPGIIFRDITSIIGNADGLKLAVDELQAAVKDLDFDVIAGLEARGFIFGMPLAYNLHKPLFRSGRRVSFRARRSLRHTIWSTGQRLLRFIKKISYPVRKSFWLTISLLPAEPSGQVSSWSKDSAQRWPESLSFWSWQV